MPEVRSVLRRPLLALALLLSLGSCGELPNVPPTASFIYSPVSPIFAGQTSVAFNASASRDSDGSIRNYIWNFGDGTGDQTRGEPTITYVFPDTNARCLEFTYTVLLTVVDDQGERGSAAQSARVIELPAPGSPQCSGS